MFAIYQNVNAKGLSIQFSMFHTLLSYFYKKKTTSKSNQLILQNFVYNFIKAFQISISLTINSSNAS